MSATCCDGVATALSLSPPVWGMRNTHGGDPGYVGFGTGGPVAEVACDGQEAPNGSLARRRRRRKSAVRDDVLHGAIVGTRLDGRWSASEDDVHALMRVPRRLLGLMGFEKELGLHNAEMTTSPQPLNPHGLRAQEPRSAPTRRRPARAAPRGCASSPTGCGASRRPARAPAST